jgi:hypothetical protein
MRVDMHWDLSGRVSTCSSCKSKIPFRRMRLATMWNGSAMRYPVKEFRCRQCGMEWLLSMVKSCQQNYLDALSSPTKNRGRMLRMSEGENNE